MICLDIACIYAESDVSNTADSTRTTPTEDD